MFLASDDRGSLDSGHHTDRDYTSDSDIPKPQSGDDVVLPRSTSLATVSTLESIVTPTKAASLENISSSSDWILVRQYSGYLMILFIYGEFLF